MTAFGFVLASSDYTVPLEAFSALQGVPVGIVRQDSGCSNAALKIA